MKHSSLLSKINITWRRIALVQCHGPRKAASIIITALYIILNWRLNAASQWGNQITSAFYLLYTITFYMHYIE